MGAMSAFLDRFESPDGRRLYAGLDERWAERAARLNGMLDAEGLPVRIANLSSIWTVLYTGSSRYNWMLQFYLRLEGLALSWVGTGRLIFSLNFDEADFNEVTRRFVQACRKMRADGWWDGPAVDDRSIRRSIAREILLRLR
jgi:glutamate-1-semialdehyde 2,1-aminomutase